MAKKKKQILIVDDLEENVAFLSQILEDNGYKFRVARNGNEALKAVKEARPDAVLLDIMMPRKTGISVFKEMKKDPKLESVPIIVITAATQVTGVDIQTGERQPKADYADDVAREIGDFLHGHFKDLKPDGFIEKPIDPPRLLKKLKKALKK